MKHDRPKILVVEDMPKLRDAYSRNIERAGFVVNSVDSKEAAINAVNRITYDVAFVDVMLSTDEDEDRSGFDVIRAIKGLSEGTKCIAVSGYPGYSAPAQAVNLGVDRYVPKADIHNPSDYVEPVKDEVKKCKLQRFGIFTEVIEYISAQGDYHIWESKCLRELGIDAAEFHNFLNRFISPLCPLLPAIGGTIMNDIVPGSGVAHISGWSKSLGVSVTVTLSRHEQIISPDLEVNEHYKGIFCTVTRTEVPRSTFVLRAADVKRKKRPRDRGRSTLA